MPVFCLVELDLVSPSSRFWGVYGFVVSLGSPSGFGSVGPVFLQPLQNGPLRISSLLPAPYLSLESLPVLLFPSPALH